MEFDKKAYARKLKATRNRALTQLTNTHQSIMEQLNNTVQTEENKEQLAMHKQIMIESYEKKYKKILTKYYMSLHEVGMFKLTRHIYELEQQMFAQNDAEVEAISEDPFVD